MNKSTNTILAKTHDSWTATLSSKSSGCPRGNDSEIHVMAAMSVLEKVQIRDSDKGQTVCK